MNKNLARMQLLKRVLSSISAGRGVSASIVLVLREGTGAEKLAARSVLLGYPPSKSMASIASDDSRELGALASLVTAASSSSAEAVGRKGIDLSRLLEGWLKVGQERAMEAKVFQLRGLIMCAVLGALMATVSTMGPIVASSAFFSSAPVTAPVPLALVSCAMVAVSSTMLGLFLSGRGFYINLALSMGVFLVASFATAPLVSEVGLSSWGIK